MYIRYCHEFFQAFHAMGMRKRKLSKAKDGVLNKVCDVRWREQGIVQVTQRVIIMPDFERINEEFD